MIIMYVVCDTTITKIVCATGGAHRHTINISQVQVDVATGGTRSSIRPVVGCSYNNGHMSAALYKAVRCFTLVGN